MSKIQRSYLQRYYVSVLSVLIALLLGLMLDSLLKLEVSPLFFAAVVLSSWYGGLAPGLLATVLAVLVNNYFFIPPIYSLIPDTWTDALQLIVFSLISLLISSLNSELHIAKQKSEAKLAKLTVSYRSLLETAYEGIWIFDQDGQTEYVNSQLAQMLGYSAEQMRDRTIFDFMEHETQIEIQQWLEQNQQHHQESKQQLEVGLRRQDAAELWVIVSLSSILNEQGKFAGMVAMLTDITERKHSETILAEEQANRDRESQLLRAMLDILPVGVVISDAKGKFIEINPAIKAIWGENAPFLDNTSQYHEYKGWRADTGQPIAAEEWTLARVLATGETIIGEEIDIESFDGQRKTILNSVVPIRDETGVIIHAVAVNVDITERKQAEEKLRQSEALAKARAEELETIMETVPAAVWIAHDPQCNQMTVNRSAYKLMRLQPGSIMTATPVSGDYTFPFKIQKNGQDVPPNELPMQQAGLTGQEVEGEFEFVFGEDDVQFLYGKAVPLRDYSGTVRGVIGAFIDITERKQAEEVLRQKQEWLDLAQTVGKIGSFEWNILTNVNIWSKELEAIYGLQPSEFGGTYEDWKNLVHPDDVAIADTYIANSLKTGEFFTDFRVVWPNGSIHWLHARAKVYYDREGKPLRMVGVNVDISDRKQAEAALRQSESRLRQLLESSIIGIIEAEPDKITFANDAFLQMLGYTQADILAGNLGWQKMTPPEYNQLDQAKVEEVFVSGVCTPFEKEYIRKDGSRVPILLGATLLTRSPFRWVCFILDLTELKQAERERAQALERERAARIELERANRMKDDFLAIVSHELRSPLNPILGWAKLLKSRRLDAAKTTQALETIERNAKLQARLIEDLLDVSRILRGKLSLNICAVDLVTTIESALETVRLAAETKSIHLHTEFAIGKVKVEGDPNRLQQIIWNLLTNAVKFTPEGGRVELRLEKVGNFAQIQVTDTGKGISAEFLPFVFDRFRQADEVTTRKFGGLGLGLAIVRHLVELHGGSVQVTSPGENLGATFTVHLPLMAATTEILIEYPLIENAPNLQGVQIVIVDDDVDTLNLLTFILEQYGATVQAVNSAQDALKAIAQTQPDLLLSDIGMPTMDGYMLIEQVRSTTSASILPAIALTAFAGEANSQKIISAGFQRHLTKPIEPAELAAVIANLMRMSKNDK
ncbi:PAS domain S-box protein [Nostoc sp. PCC 7107]|uniref:PAS domain S-box protein n=1 Tax=Nostoc sp. PCC 7107 TaxID=317936 RepID=UPI00029F4158|nr:PAS domain S-box protein [Nostoc sp. PCC 7107]AFY45908.1 multi-sensor hybrid histidine kinase [Nostoc sp. PCC 7107]